MEKVLEVEVLKEVLEDEVEECAAKGRVTDDEGLEKQGALVDGIAFEYSGFLDRSRLSAVKVVVVATSFPWWACVLGKTGAKVERICLFLLRLGSHWPLPISPCSIFRWFASSAWLTLEV
jgi:hypothetical protein